MALLLTAFNVRLGRWVGNPTDDGAWKSRSPPVALYYLLREFAGAIKADSQFVYLSDGGHFENTATYELIRRRVPLIVMSDCGADPLYEFSDFANLVRLAKADFGVPIDVDFSPLRPNSEGISAAQAVVGVVRYSVANAKDRDGVIIILKPTLAERSSEDTLQYRHVDPTFPQQTTSDQWYSEAQFESYRKLGYDAITRALRFSSPIRMQFDAAAQS
jgi:hypothetical protein